MGLLTSPFAGCSSPESGLTPNQDSTVKLTLVAGEMPPSPHWPCDGMGVGKIAIPQLPAAGGRAGPQGHESRKAGPAPYQLQQAGELALMVVVKVVGR